jgi:hypothetical protein
MHTPGGTMFQRGFRAGLEPGAPRRRVFPDMP